MGTEHIINSVSGVTVRKWKAESCRGSVGVCSPTFGAIPLQAAHPPERDKRPYRGFRHCSLRWD